MCNPVKHFGYTYKATMHGREKRDTVMSLGNYETRIYGAKFTLPTHMAIKWGPSKMRMHREHREFLSHENNINGF